MKNFDKTYKQNWQHCAKEGTTTHLTEEKKRENKYLGIEKSNFSCIFLNPNDFFQFEF